MSYKTNGNAQIFQYVQLTDMYIQTVQYRKDK